MRLALALGLGILGVAAACSNPDPIPSVSSSVVRTHAELRGLYASHGALGTLAFLEDGTYVQRPAGCAKVACTEVGAARFDGTTLTLTSNAGASRTLRVQVHATTTVSKLATRELVTGGDDEPLVDAGAELVPAVTEATIEGEPVELLVRAKGEADGGNGNASRPPWPGSIPGTGPLLSPIGEEATHRWPSGNAVTVATNGDMKDIFVDDAALARHYAGTANIYNSHGMPGQLLGGIPEGDVRRFLNESSDPLIVASCFSGAAMSGGSSIRRLVSAYADDPSVASRVYGCTGFASASSASGIGCTGTWVDANQRAVPLIERQRLGLSQYRCSTNTYNAKGPVWSDCAPAD